MDKEYKDWLEREVKQAREEVKAGLLMSKEQVLNQIRKNRIDREHRLLRKTA